MKMSRTVHISREGARSAARNSQQTFINGAFQMDDEISNRVLNMQYINEQEQLASKKVHLRGYIQKSPD
jgi:hypothetical protein